MPPSPSPFKEGRVYEEPIQLLLEEETVLTEGVEEYSISIDETVNVLTPEINEVNMIFIPPTDE